MCDGKKKIRTGLEKNVKCALPEQKLDYFRIKTTRPGAPDNLRPGQSVLKAILTENLVRGFSSLVLDFLFFFD